MRIVYVFMLVGMVVGMLGLVTGVALADPGNTPDEKEWHYVMQGTRSTGPEIESNDTCPTAMPVQPGDVVDPATISSGTDLDWFKLTVAEGTMITIGTDAGTGCGSPYLLDSYIELYYNCGTTRVARDDDGGPGNYSLLSYTVPMGAGGEYEVKVRGYSSSYTGCYKIFFTCTVPPRPPVNGTCATAIDILRGTNGTITGDLTLGSDSYSPGTYPTSCTGYSAAGRDVVYRLVLHANDVLDMSYVQPNYDAELYIITACADPQGSCVLGADAAFSGQPEVVHWICPTSGTYYLLCDTYSGGGPFTLIYNITCPPPMGACCAQDGSCNLTVEADCLDPSVWHVELTSCGPDNPCQQPVGACCAADGSCTVTTQNGCAAPGSWLADFTTCATNPCPQPLGVCCARDGSCSITTQSGCVAPSTWLADFTSCRTNPCPPPPPSACCDRTTGGCTITTQAECLFEWLGVDVSCTVTTCPPPPTGACCNSATGECTITTLADCRFVWKGLGNPCGPAVCPPPEGTCCDPTTGVCLMRIQADCPHPLVWTLGGVCTPNPCPPPPTPIERSTWGHIKSKYR